MVVHSHFRINEIDVGVSARTDVRVVCGRIRIRISSEPFELTRELVGNYGDDYTPVPGLYLESGLSISLHGDLGIPDAVYGTSVTFPHVDEAKYLHQLDVYGDRFRPTFFGQVLADEGMLRIRGILANEYEIADVTESIAIDVQIPFVAKALIPPRKKFSLREALKQSPLDVYWLHIDRNEATDSFPVEVFQFKNLECLWFTGNFGNKRVPLPVEIFALTHLHTLSLQWARFTVGELSSEIKNLRSLETLWLTGNQITRLPEEMCELRKLSSLDISGNQLQSLPACIGDLPVLKRLDARYNRFESLPSSLTNIPTVEIEWRYRALYKDTTYKSAYPAANRPSDLDLASDFERFAQTKALVQSLSTNAALIDIFMSYSRRAIYAVPDGKMKRVSLGASKVGGAPHLPQDLAHPCDRNRRLLTFMAQINLSEIASLQAWLPRTGMLYFFLSDEQTGERCSVLHVDATASSLREYVYDAKTKWVNSDRDAYAEDVEPSVTTESLLAFSVGVSIPSPRLAIGDTLPHLVWEGPNFTREGHREFVAFDTALTDLEDKLIRKGLRPNQRSHLLNGFVAHENDPRNQAADAGGGRAHEWIALLTLDSVGDINIGDAGAMTFCVHQNDLAAADFSRVICCISS